MSSLDKVILIGASGTLGTALLTSLTKANINVTVLTRPDSTSTSNYPGNTKIIKTAYTQPELARAFTGHDAVISATGLPGIPLQTIFIDACITAGVSRYITNDFGNAPDFHGLPELEWTRKPKLEILAYAKRAADDTTPRGSFTWSALATGHFLDLAIVKFPAVFGFDVPARRARLVDGGDEPFSATTLADIGDAVVGILRHPEQTANRSLLVRSLETTQLDLLNAFEEVTGAKWAVEHVDSKELYESGKVKMAQGDRSAIITLLPVQIFEKGAARYAFPRERYDNLLLGVEEKSADQVVRDVLANM